MNIAGVRVKSIEALDIKELENRLEDIIQGIEFPDRILEFIKKNKWISIPDLNLYFNKEIMACYPIFKHITEDIEVNEGDKVTSALKNLNKNKDYKKIRVKWDIQTLNEGRNSFYKKSSPMGEMRIKNRSNLSYKGEDNLIHAYSNIDLSKRETGMLIPIFRLVEEEEFNQKNIKAKGLKYDEKVIVLLFMLNGIIPFFNNLSLDRIYLKLHKNVTKECKEYFKYVKGFGLDKDKKIVAKFDLDKIGKLIISADDKNICENSKVKFILENEDTLEISFSQEEHLGSGKYIYKNGDKEVCEFKKDKKGNLIKIGKTTINKANGDVERFTYEEGMPEGESEYIYKNGDRELRTYINGQIDGDIKFYPKGKKNFQLSRVIEGKKKDATLLKKFLDVDKVRVNLNSYDESILTDINRGHWDIDEKDDLDKLEEITGKKVYIRDAREDIKHGGIVGIDFGTKSTVVVFQDNRNQTFPMRISGGNLINEVKESDFENPTVIEFKDIKSFIKDYNKKEGRPYTKWKDVMVSHTASQNMLHGTGDEFISFISELKQWAGLKNEKLMMRDGKGVEKIFPPYMELKDGDIDPIELYAYYIGSYINNMINGIYMEYFLSFPVTYEKAVREKILQSFERGIKKSLPLSILKDENSMKRFKVRHGANEPAAYAVCALQEYGFEVEDGEDVYYGVFDFGGGTADFDFGIWRASEDEKKFDYELTHFGAGGDRYLGGENILKELAYEILKENHELLRKKNISFAKPEWCKRFVGDEGLVDKSPEAKLNIKRMMEKLRPFWETSTETSVEDGKLKVNLYSKDGSAETGIELTISKEKIEKFIENKIEKGVKNFFMAMKKAMKDENITKINIFLAGNSCKHPKVMDLFEKHRNDFKGEVEIFPALGTEEAYEKMEELEIQIDPNDPTNPTGKTGVAYGIIDSRAGGRIDIKNSDEESNIDNEINFRYYVGYEGRKKLKVVLGPQTQYEQFIHYLDTTADVFDLYYTTLPEAMNSKMPIVKAIRKRIELKNEYLDGKIYIKAISPDTIKYVVTQKDIDMKEYLEQGEIKLD